MTQPTQPDMPKNESVDEQTAATSQKRKLTAGSLTKAFTKFAAMGFAAYAIKSAVTMGIAALGMSAILPGIIMTGATLAIGALAVGAAFTGARAVMDYKNQKAALSPDTTFKNFVGGQSGYYTKMMLRTSVISFVGAALFEGLAQSGVFDWVKDTIFGNGEDNVAGATPAAPDTSGTSVDTNAPETTDHSNTGDSSTASQDTQTTSDNAQSDDQNTSDTPQTDAPTETNSPAAEETAPVSNTENTASSQSQTQTQVQNSGEGQSQAQAQTQTQSSNGNHQVQSQTQTQTQTGNGAQSQYQTQTQTQSTGDAHSQSQSQAQAQTQSGGYGAQSQVQIQTQSQSISIGSNNVQAFSGETVDAPQSEALTTKELNERELARIIALNEASAPQSAPLNDLDIAPIDYDLSDYIIEENNIDLGNIETDLPQITDFNLEASDTIETAAPMYEAAIETPNSAPLNPEVAQTPVEPTAQLQVSEPLPASMQENIAWQDTNGQWQLNAADPYLEPGESIEFAKQVSYTGLDGSTVTENINTIMISNSSAQTVPIQQAFEQATASADRGFAVIEQSQSQMQVQTSGNGYAAPVQVNNINIAAR